MGGWVLGCHCLYAVSLNQLYKIPCSDPDKSSGIQSLLIKRAQARHIPKKKCRPRWAWPPTIFVSATQMGLPLSGYKYLESPDLTRHQNGVKDQPIFFRVVPNHFFFGSDLETPGLKTFTCGPLAPIEFLRQQMDCEASELFFATNMMFFPNRTASTTTRK